MTQPNFLQVATSLKRAVAFCEARPELQSSQRYGEGVREAREHFEHATRETDATYTRWRQLLGEELKEFRDMRLEYDRVMALADEHGYDDAPRRKIVYTERDHLMTLIGETIAWLKGHEGEWDWIAESIGALESHVAEARRRRKMSQVTYEAYTISVKARVAAYDHSVALVREYLRDANSEARGDEALARVQLDVL